MGNWCKNKTDGFYGNDMKEKNMKTKKIKSTTLNRIENEENKTKHNN